MQVTDSLGNRYRLGDALGQGGEGVVYKIQSQPDQAAKIYHQPPPAELATKLGAMAAMATDDPARGGELAAAGAQAAAPKPQSPVARDAWPTDADSRRDGPVAEEIHRPATGAATGLE